jgi:hypothetical protein
LSLYAGTMHHATKRCGKSGGKTPCIRHFITEWQLVVRYTNNSEKRSVLDGRREVSFTLRILYPEDRAPETPFSRRLGNQCRANSLEKRKNLFAQLGVEPRFLFVQSVAKSLYWLRSSGNWSYKYKIHFKTNKSVLSLQVLGLSSQRQKIDFYAVILKTRETLDCSW